MARIERKLAAILAADVAGYSALVGNDEEATIRSFSAHLSALGPIIGAHTGRLFKTMGDGFLVEFGSVVDAVSCAVAMQRRIGERNADEPQARRLVFRMGVHMGDVIVESDDILGDGVNVAARLEGIAKPGGVCRYARLALPAASALSRYSRVSFATSWVCRRRRIASGSTANPYALTSLNWRMEQRRPDGFRA